MKPKILKQYLSAQRPNILLMTHLAASLLGSSGAQLVKLAVSLL